MKEYIKLAAIIAVLGVTFTSMTAQAGSHNGASKGKANARGMNPNANARAAAGAQNGMGGTDGSSRPAMPAMDKPAMPGANAAANAHGMNPNANPRAALGGMNRNDRAAAAQARNEERMAQRDAEKAARKAEQAAKRAANAGKVMAEDAGAVVEPAPLDPNLPI